MNGSEQLSINPASSNVSPVTANVLQEKKLESVSTPSAPPIQEDIADIDGNYIKNYEINPDGTVKEKKAEEESATQSGKLLGGLKKFGHYLATSKAAKLKSFFLPDNMPHSVSRDYKAVRSWSFLSDIGWNAANYATGAGIAIALGVNPVWGGAGMAAYNLIMDKFCQTTGFAATMAVPRADKNPRPWIVAGTALDTVGMALQSAVAITAGISGALLPIAMTGAFIRVFSGSMKGAAMANVEPRQAKAGNLGEIQRKNGNQNFVSNVIGSAIGLYAVKFLAGTLGLGVLAPPIAVAAGAAVAVAATAAMLKKLDYHPVNEKALRKIIDKFEKDKVIPGPETSLINTLKDLKKTDTINLGSEIKPLLSDMERFEDLKKLYSGRNYILEVKDGKTSIVLHENVKEEERVSAVLQAIHVDRLKESEAYKSLLSEKDSVKADRWLVRESLSKTPKDAKPMLENLQKAGWSTDLLRFYDTGKRAKWGNSANSEMQYDFSFLKPQSK